MHTMLRALAVSCAVVLLAPLGALSAPQRLCPDPFASVPSVAIIGAAKAGTTDLYAELTGRATHSSDPERPEPFFAHSVTKEVDFWGHSHLHHEQMNIHFPVYREYLTRLGHPCAAEPEACPCALPGLRRAADPRRCQLLPLTIDATTTYILHPQVPNLMALAAPCSKTILMMRDPVSRSISHYNHLEALGHWLPPMNQLVEEFLDRLSNTPHYAHALAEARSNMWTSLESVAQAWYTLSLDTHDQRILQTSLYPYAMAAWRHVYFQPGLTLVINSDFYSEDREAVMEQVVDFLYMRPLTTAERDAARSAAVTNSHNAHIAKDAAVDEKGEIVVSSSVKGNVTVVIDAATGLSKNSLMSPDAEQKLKRFFEDHTNSLMPELLTQLQEEGVRLVGFTPGKKPWSYA